MSQSRPTYYARGTPATLDAFKSRRCTLPYSAPDYRDPTPTEVDALIKLMGWSQNDAAKLLGVTYNPKKGSVANIWQGRTILILSFPLRG